MAWTCSIKYKPEHTPQNNEDRILIGDRYHSEAHLVINYQGYIGYYNNFVFTQVGTTQLSLGNMYLFHVVSGEDGTGKIYLDGAVLGLIVSGYPIHKPNLIGNYRTRLRPEVGLKPHVGLKPRPDGSAMTRPCLGLLDEFYIWDREVTQNEIISQKNGSSLVKLSTLADWYLDQANDDNMLTPIEKQSYYLPEWIKQYAVRDVTTMLPTAIASITADGEYKVMANAANAQGIWTPTINGTLAYVYYMAINTYRDYLFVSATNGFLHSDQIENVSIVNGEYIDAMIAAINSAMRNLTIQINAVDSQTKANNAETNSKDYADDLDAALRMQTDRAIDFYTQTSDPSTAWTDSATKILHKGDYWRTGTASAWQTWSGSAWSVVNDPEALAVANLAQSTANIKRRVFTSTPTSPYDVGDLWVAGSTGDIKNCITARALGNYDPSEWALASKYTDDTTANTKSKTFIQTTAPASGMQAGDYWLDSDDNYKPYVYRAGVWNVDLAMESAINAQTTANLKTTCWGTLAIAQTSSVIGDLFVDNSKIYRTTVAASLVTISNSTRLTAQSWGNLGAAPASGMITNDTYYNTNTTAWYIFNGSTWVIDGSAQTDVVATYTPKYLGIGMLYATSTSTYQSATVNTLGEVTRGADTVPNKGDRLVNWSAEYNVTKGIYVWNGALWTSTTDMKHIGESALDILYLNIGGIAIDGLTAYTNALILNLFTQNMKHLSGGKIYSGNGNYNNADTPSYIGADGKVSFGTGLVWDGTSLSLTGAVNATSGSFSSDNSSTRVYVSGGNIYFQVYSSGSWVTKAIMLGYSGGIRVSGFISSTDGLSTNESVYAAKIISSNGFCSTVPSGIYSSGYVAISGLYNDLYALYRELDRTYSCDIEIVLRTGSSPYIYTYYHVYSYTYNLGSVTLNMTDISLTSTYGTHTTKVITSSTEGIAQWSGGVF